MIEELALVGVVAVLVIVAVAYFAQKLGVAAPVILVLLGIGVSLLPGMPEIVIEPEWILYIVLPPILYSAAVNVPVIDFRRDFGTIGALSVGLVIISAFGTGLLLWWMMPDLGLPAAVALGAVISPPDAVAATAIGKKLGLPPRLVTILEGEGLVNDATALVLLRTSIAAMAGSFTFWGALGTFAYAAFVGVAVGGLVGISTVAVRSKIRQQPVLTTAISFVVPFLAFIPAEELHASGVIAVVTAGLITGHQSARRLAAQDRISERTNWRTAQLLLENGVFLLMGLELTSVLNAVDQRDPSIGITILIGLILVVALLVMRIAFLVPVIGVMRRRQRRSAELEPKLDRILTRLDSALATDASEKDRRRMQFARRRQADMRFRVQEVLGWRGGLVLGWSGMRGVVTLAAAQSLPTDTPHRAELVLIAFTVAIITLVLYGGTLPFLIKALGIRGSDAKHTQREFDRLSGHIAEATIAFLDGPGLRRANGEPFSAEAVQSERERVARTMQNIRSRAVEQVKGAPTELGELRRLVAEAQQDALIDAQETGTFSSHTLEIAQQVMDIEAARFRSH